MNWISAKTPPTDKKIGPITVIGVIDDPTLKMNGDDPFVDIVTYWPDRKQWTVIHTSRATKGADDYPCNVSLWKHLDPIPGYFPLPEDCPEVEFSDIQDPNNWSTSNIGEASQSGPVWVVHVTDKELAAQAIVRGALNTEIDDLIINVDRLTERAYKLYGNLSIPGIKVTDEKAE